MSDDEIEGTVRDLTRFGEGVVKTEQGAVFAPGTLPGERVAVGNVRKRGKALRASRVRILDSSGQRVDPPCPIVGRCGGCPLMIATRPLQEKFKRGLLQQALDGLPGADEVALGWVGTKESLGYRRRARLSWTRSPAGLRLGYHPPRSDKVADVRACAVLHPTLDRGYRAVRRALDRHLVDHGELHLAAGAGDRPVAALRSEEPQPPEVYRELEQLVEDGRLAGAALRCGGAATDATWGDPRERRVGVDGEPLVGTVAGFSQAHDTVNRALVGRVIELASPAKRHVLELFSGAGNLTVALAREAATLLAIEQDEAAAEACRENLRARGLDATVRTDDAESYRAPERPDVVVLDPPRTGAPGAMRRILRLEPSVVVYVSCDPPTLGRDLKVLVNGGYTATDAIGLDMFPQTAHLECVVRLER
ncbi:MAG TPA: RsmD family RNA methyltransferase [Sandaracinaceae bacterium LLY-WYZ-13_1]|nr:RsmD family RNA methyltransferase [Sandaracinaceae bacterium LLY-WYZ-13_1]